MTPSALRLFERLARSVAATTLALLVLQWPLAAQHAVRRAIDGRPDPVLADEPVHGFEVSSRADVDSRRRRAEPHQSSYRDIARKAG